MTTDYKWGSQPQTVTVAFFHRQIRELVAERFAATGRSWEEAVWDPKLELSKEDFEKVEQALLETGHRFDFSARISVEEAPAKYKPLAAESDLGALERDDQGRAVVGTGDNVFQVDKNVVGTARFISTIETVLDMLTEGVPDETVAIIDDSGGTLTAPILEGFTAVVCKGGTIRSHLGILTREYRIPCLMAAELSGISDGDRVEVEYTTKAVSPYDTEGNVRAHVWKLD
jgi:hypothetical protein